MLRQFSKFLSNSKDSSSFFEKVSAKNAPKLLDFVDETCQTLTPLVEYAGAFLTPSYERLPSWLRTSIPVGQQFSETRRAITDLGLNTVCQEARCPNIGECWSGPHPTATIMVSGGRFILVDHGKQVHSGMQILLCAHITQASAPRSD